VVTAAAAALSVLGAPASARPVQGNPTLTVSVTGNGTVKSSPSGIDCPSKCSASYSPRTTVSLSASPDSGWTFSGWGGDCSGTGGCKVAMTTNRHVSATFKGPTAPPPPPPPPPKPKFTLTVTVTGDGSVSSNPTGITCGADCTQDYDQGTIVTLAPFPGASNFAGWGGACSGTGLCTVAMISAQTVSATFVGRARAPVQTKPTPNAPGIVNQATTGRPFHLTLKFICYSHNELFLVELYKDVLKRAVDPAAFALYVPQLNTGTPPGKVALAVLQSLEYRTLLVQGFYNGFLHRPPAPPELVFALATLVGGTSDEDFEATLLGSTEYLNSRGGGTTSGFITALFQDVLGRAPTAAEQAFFGNAPRVQVAKDVLVGTEARTLLVRRYFDAFLNRPPTQAELNTFLGLLGSGATDENVAADILGSAEYVAKSGEYQGTVRWADGTTSPGQITQLGKRCTLAGLHTYKTPGSRLLMVDVLAPDLSKTTLTRRVLVAAGPTAPGPGTPPPPGKENVQTSGQVLIKVNGKFVPLKGFKQVPFGTELDTTKGRVKLTSHDGSVGTFYEGRFKLVPGLDTPVPGKKSRRVTELVLTGGNFKACPATRSTAGAAKAKPKHKLVRHAWGNAKGSFRTKGRYASATVRGTLWRTDDFCDGTLVTVRRGRVDVFDIVKRKHVLVPAGRSYFVPH
jgi:Divergent InlB B-repeat domain/Domain of unknown function (DUF4214)